MELLDNLNWMRNRAWSPDVKLPRLMFCHIPKTGGMSVFNAIKFAIYFYSQAIVRENPRFSGFNVDRVDKVQSVNLVDSLWFVGTHLPYGWHLRSRYGPKFKLFTVLRDPFRRVLSQYTYDCMRNDRRPSAEEFKAFAALPENCNVMVRYFCGGELKSRLDVSLAVGLLESNFIAYDTINHIPDLIEGVLNYANLPNVMMEKRLNYTLNEFRLSVPEVRPLVEAFNLADLEFYKAIESRPRRLEIPQKEGSHPLSVILQESGGRENSLTYSKSIPTQKLLEIVSCSHTASEFFSKVFPVE